MSGVAFVGSGHRTTHAHIVDAIGLRVLRGEVEPDATLPVEDDLCRQLGVSRGALREAVRSLVAKGLLQVRPRTGTRVRPRHEWNFLDADVLRWQQEIDADRMLRDLTEMRHAVEPEAARIAALRAGDDDVEELRDAFSAMATAVDDDDRDAFNEADVTFHRLLLRAGGNDLFASLERAIEVALRSSFVTLSAAPGAPRATLPLHRAVLDAIASRDPGRFADAAHRMVYGARGSRR